MTILTVVKNTITMYYKLLQLLREMLCDNNDLQVNTQFKNAPFSLM